MSHTIMLSGITKNGIDINLVSQAYKNMYNYTPIPERTNRKNNIEKYVGGVFGHE
jgi:hypothetical protein